MLKISGTSSFVRRLTGKPMELLLVRIWVLVVTFCFGISVSALWRIYTLPALPIPVVELTPPRHEVAEQPEGPKILNERHNCGALPAKRPKDHKRRFPL